MKNNPEDTMKLSEAIRYTMSVQHVRHSCLCRVMERRVCSPDLPSPIPYAGCSLCPFRGIYSHDKGILNDLGLDYSRCRDFTDACRRGTKKALAALEEIVLALEMQDD